MQSTSLVFGIFYFIAFLLLCRLSHKNTSMNIQQPTTTTVLMFFRQLLTLNYVKLTTGWEPTSFCFS